MLGRDFAYVVVKSRDGWALRTLLVPQTQTVLNIERGSKTNSGSAKNFCYENKVPCPAIPQQQPRCLVFLMDLYWTKLPKFAFEHDVLYLRPKRTTPSDPNAPCIGVFRPGQARALPVYLQSKVIKTVKKVIKTVIVLSKQLWAVYDNTKPQHTPINTRWFTT